MLNLLSRSKIHKAGLVTIVGREMSHLGGHQVAGGRQSHLLEFYLDLDVQDWGKVHFVLNS